MARQVGVAAVAENLTVDLEISAGLSLLAPQRVLPERAVLGIEILFPQRRRLDDMAVAVEDGEIFRRHASLRHHDRFGAVSLSLLPRQGCLGA